MPFLLQNLFLAIAMLISRKLVQNKWNLWKMRIFFCYSLAVMIIKDLKLFKNAQMNYIIFLYFLDI